MIERVFYDKFPIGSTNGMTGAAIVMQDIYVKQLKRINTGELCIS
jgi:hypothetical protein